MAIDPITATILSCLCGCGVSTKKGNRFLHGHNKSTLGKALSEEHKRKISDANKGYIPSEETRKKLSLAGIGNQRRKGKKLSEEHKKAISESLKGNKHTLGYHHTEETRRKIGTYQNGKTHHNWKGGITSKNKKIRNSIDYRIWRESVFKRDTWTCCECGERGITLHPHHIKKFSEYPGLRFDTDNGITLCKDCHNNFHWRNKNA